MTNTIFLDQKYISFLANRLKNYRNKGNGLYEFTHSCERGESNKRRGYFYKKGTGYNFMCHNCGDSKKFFNFLKETDGNLYKEYTLESFRENLSPVHNEEKIDLKPKEKKIFHVEGLTNLVDCKPEHPVWEYINKRKIPKERHADLYFCKDFTKWASMINDSFSNLKITEPRLIIPYRNKSNEVIGFTCRSFRKHSTRKYIELKLVDEEMIYGVEYLNHSKKIICVEGPIDSMFIDNCISIGGASYKENFLNIYKNNLIIVPDNDWKRNKQVCDQLISAANKGFTVSLLPDNFKEKDINDAIINNSFTSEQILEMIKQNARSGTDLLLDITFRRKC